MTLHTKRKLPIKYFTPSHWAISVLSDQDSLLCDHAYLERKAASNALDLANRWVEPKSAEHWMLTLSMIAKEEAAHLHLVTKLIIERGGRLTRTHKSRYANDLRQLVRTGTGNLEVLDRLLVSALIEVRSCERFLILAEMASEQDLKQLYHGLYASEVGHYKTFLSLSQSVASEEEVQTRWEWMLVHEAQIIQAQPPGTTLHSGVFEP